MKPEDIQAAIASIPNAQALDGRVFLPAIAVLNLMQERDALKRALFDEQQNHQQTTRVMAERVMGLEKTLATSNDADAATEYCMKCLQCQRYPCNMYMECIHSPKAPHGLLLADGFREIADMEATA
jgi:hypothetical protein